MSLKLGLVVGTGIDMKLTLYQFQGDRRILLIYLGESDGYVVGLDSTAIPAGEKALLAQYMKAHQSASPDQTLSFLKKHCKVAYAKAYRRIKSENLKSMKTYEI
jgi:hypothetical protein